MNEQKQQSADSTEKPCLRDRLRKRFLDCLKDYGLVTYAAQKAGIPRKTVYNWRSDDPAFKEQWEDAIELFRDSLEKELTDRGKDRRRAEATSDKSLITRLRAERPEKYNPVARNEHRGELKIEIVYKDQAKEE